MLESHMAAELREHQRGLEMGLLEEEMLRQTPSHQWRSVGKK